MKAAGRGFLEITLPVKRHRGELTGTNLHSSMDREIKNLLPSTAPTVPEQYTPTPVARPASPIPHHAPPPENHDGPHVRFVHTGAPLGAHYGAFAAAPTFAAAPSLPTLAGAPNLTPTLTPLSTLPTFAAAPTLAATPTFAAHRQCRYRALFDALGTALPEELAPELAVPAA